ncbi:hypothetical protein [Phenylobacterium immobile]|uniref:hypothetical protein n=1 Tax=Phenylobacterium immobile TaxID=21 RepID=UPI000A98BC4B|nr:hypothetical protein [Phenylobacterium immobile]
MPFRALTLAAAALLIAAPLSAAAQDPVRPGREAGLGVTGPDTPDELERIQADPYAPPRAPGCEGVAAELADLDAILGPDVDKAKAEKASGVGAAVGGAVKSLIPYRGVVRFVTGAGKKEQALVDASMAGSARRGYLRGLQASMSCNTGAPAVESTAADAAATAPVAALAEAQITQD